MSHTGTRHSLQRMILASVASRGSASLSALCEDCDGHHSEAQLRRYADLLARQKQILRFERPVGGGVMILYEPLSVRSGNPATTKTSHEARAPRLAPPVGLPRRCPLDADLLDALADERAKSVADLRESLCVASETRMREVVARLLDAKLVERTRAGDSPGLRITAGGLAALSAWGRT